jgi:hypothetical protein
VVVGGDVGILAVYSPTQAISDTVREMFAITATSTLSPSQLVATASTVVLGPMWSPFEGLSPGPPALPGVSVYVPSGLQSYIGGW